MIYIWGSSNGPVVQGYVNERGEGGRGGKGEERRR